MKRLLVVPFLVACWAMPVAADEVLNTPGPLPPELAEALPFPLPEVCICSATQGLDAQTAGALNAGMAFLAAEDYPAAYAMLRPLAEAGVPHAQYLLGRGYDMGLGLEQSDEIALEWYEAAARQGHVQAMQGIAIVAVKDYWGGDLIHHPIHLQTAAMIAVGATCNYSRGQLSLGNDYLVGHGVEGDINEAWFWLEVAKANQDRYWWRYYIPYEPMIPEETKLLAQERARAWLADAGPLCFPDSR